MHRKRFVKKGLSWLLSAALTIGLLSATGLTAGAEILSTEQTVSLEGAVSETDPLSPKETASASDAGKKEETGQDSRPAEEEPLDEEGVLLDGEVADIPDLDPEEADTATRSNALLAKKRENYPLLFPYFETITSDRLTFRLYARNMMLGEDKVYFSFIMLSPLKNCCSHKQPCRKRRTFRIRRRACFRDLRFQKRAEHRTWYSIHNPCLRYVWCSR